MPAFCRRARAALAGALLVSGPVHAVETLKIATSVPAGTSFVKELRAADRTIRERTEGRVELKLFPGGVMGSDSAVLRKIRIGQLHGAVVTANGIARIDPQAQVYSLPFLFRNRAEIEYVRERLDPVIRERVRDDGFVVAGISEGGFTYLFSKEPIASLDDLARSKVWVPQGDEITARMFRNAGAQPVSLPIADVYTSLQSGLVDTVAINPSGAIALQWHTGVEHYTRAPLLFLMGMLVLDRRAFEGLDEADREIVREVLSETFDRLDEINAKDNAEALAALEGLGIEAVEPAQAPADGGWETIARDTLADMADAGAFSPELLERVRALVDEYRREHGG
jgi:TRAP-type C4-dicarboxylate transport system substrate-binding protein